MPELHNAASLALGCNGPRKRSVSTTQLPDVEVIGPRGLSGQYTPLARTSFPGSLDAEVRKWSGERGPPGASFRTGGMERREAVPRLCWKLHPESNNVFPRKADCVLHLFKTLESSSSHSYVGSQRLAHNVSSLHIFHPLLSFPCTVQPRILLPGTTCEGLDHSGPPPPVTPLPGSVLSNREFQQRQHRIIHTSPLLSCTLIVPGLHVALRSIDTVVQSRSHVGH